MKANLHKIPERTLHEAIALTDIKYVYGSPGNEDLLLSLIDAILPEKHISKVELRQQEQIPDSRKQRRSAQERGNTSSTRCM